MYRDTVEPTLNVACSTCAVHTHVHDFCTLFLSISSAAPPGIDIARRCPMPDHPPCQIIPHPLAQSASAPGSCKIVYDSLFSTLRLAALIEWETEIRQAGEAVLFYLENDENNALRFSHGFAVDFETLK